MYSQQKASLPRAQNVDYFDIYYVAAIPAKKICGNAEEENETRRVGESDKRSSLRQQQKGVSFLNLFKFVCLSEIFEI